MSVPLSVWLASIAAVLGGGLVWFGVAGPRSDRRSRQRLTASTKLDGDLALHQPARDRLMTVMPSGLVRSLRRATPRGFSEDIERRIGRAGLTHRYTVDGFLALKLMCALGAGLIFVFFAVTQVSSVLLLLAFAVAGIAFFVPDLVIHRRAESRDLEMSRQLADITDQLVISVEAGSSFDHAINRIATRSDGPLQQEWRRVIQDMHLGLSRSEALQALANRTGVAELRELALTIAQSEDQGLAVGRVLRVQADEIRQRRRQHAEEVAMKVPVKIVFPLITCILPCLLGVILGPALVRIFQEIQF